MWRWSLFFSIDYWSIQYCTEYSCFGHLSGGGHFHIKLMTRVLISILGSCRTRYWLTLSFWQYVWFYLEVIIFRSNNHAEALISSLGSSSTRNSRLWPSVWTWRFSHQTDYQRNDCGLISFRTIFWAFGHLSGDGHFLIPIAQCSIDE